MAFKRTSFTSFASTTKEFFASKYQFSKVVDFSVPGTEYYVLFLGLEEGYYETPCHTVAPYKKGGQMIGLFGNGYNATIKCHGVDENGNKTHSLCCELYQKEKERCADFKDRIISGTTYRVHIPVLILGNSMGLEKGAYPVTKISILNELNSERGLRFAYIDMASSSFKTNILTAYGSKLKEEGLMDYDLSTESPEFFDEMRKHLSNTVIKVTATKKEGWKGAPLKTFSFFSFNNTGVASASPQGERDAIINYRKNAQIMSKVNEFLTLFNVEVDNIIASKSDKDLQLYYDSAIAAITGEPAPTESSAEPAQEQKVEIVQPVAATVATPRPVQAVRPAQPVQEHVPGQLSAEDSAIIDQELSNLSSPVSEDVTLGETEIAYDEVDEIGFDTEAGDDFFE